MAVVMKGGTSGNRQDALPPVPSSGQAQPVLNTAGNKPQPDVFYNTNHARPHRHGQHLSYDMPTSGATSHIDANGLLSIPTTEDVSQQDIRGCGEHSGNHAMFKGSPNTGTKGGPSVPRNGGAE